MLCLEDQLLVSRPILSSQFIRKRGIGQMHNSMYIMSRNVKHINTRKNETLRVEMVGRKIYQIHEETVCDTRAARGGIRVK